MAAYSTKYTYTYYVTTGCRESYCERYSGWQSTFATDAEATSSADMADPFATGDAPGTGATTTVTAIVVSTSATTAVAVDKQISRGDTCLTCVVILSKVVF